MSRLSDRETRRSLKHVHNRISKQRYVRDYKVFQYIDKTIDWRKLNIKRRTTAECIEKWKKGLQQVPRVWTKPKLLAYYFPNNAWVICFDTETLFQPTVFNRPVRDIDRDKQVVCTKETDENVRVPDIVPTDTEQVILPASENVSQPIDMDEIIRQLIVSEKEDWNRYTNSEMFQL